MSAGPPKTGEIYFEFTAYGSYVKVTAIDPATGIEATIVGDRNASQSELESLALQKLDRVRAKREKTPPHGKGVLA